jgi:hypothetical protein
MVHTEGSSYGPKVRLIWKGKRHFILHTPAQAIYTGSVISRPIAKARLYIMRKMLRTQTGEWECREVKSVTPGAYSVRTRLEIIAEAEALDRAKD